MRPSVSLILRMLALEGALVLPALIILWEGGLSPASRNLTDIPGRLTYNGKPVSRCSVVLVRTGQADPIMAALCPVLPDGSFSLPIERDDSPLDPGRYDLFVSLDEYYLEWYKHGRSEAEGPEPVVPVPLGIHTPPRQLRLPIRFMNPHTSGLWVTIKWEPTRILCYDIALRD